MWRRRQDGNVLSCGQGVEEIGGQCHGGSSSGSLGIPPSFCPPLCVGFVTRGEQMTTQTVAISSPTPSHGVRQRECSSLLRVSGENAAPFPGIPRSSFCSEGLGLGGPSELGEPHLQVFLEESLSPCCPSIIVNSAPFH